jgi:ubiquinone/menaquinone biosynthesis C-methylase UbiE
MLKSALDFVMERRARQLMDHVGAWLPAEGPVLDLGSGTGHLAARLHRERGLEMVTADVSDMHVVGPPPVLIADGVLPFEENTFTAALLFFMLAYPHDPAGVLHEAARVTRGPSPFMRIALVICRCASGSSSGRSRRSTFPGSSATCRRRPGSR